MKIQKLLSSLFLSTLLLPFGACTDEVADEPGTTETSLAETPAAVQALVLSEDPGVAVGVVAAKQAGAAEAVVVEGRVQQLTPGFAMLRLTDTALPYCGENDSDDQCKTPWDYCCESKDDRAANSLLVEFRGADGRPLSTPGLPETRHCDLLKVRGAMITDANGNPVLVADGMFRVERPELPDYVRWPSGN